MTITDSRPATVVAATTDASPDATSPRPTKPLSVTKARPSDGPNSHSTILVAASIDRPSGGPTSPAARHEAMAMGVSPQGFKSIGGQTHRDTHRGVAAGSVSPAAERAAASMPDAPQGTTATGGRMSDEARLVLAAGSDVPGPAAIATSSPIATSLLDPALSLAADILDDLERVRIANENRLRQLTRTETDSDGEDRGFGLDESHPDVARLAAMVDTLKAVEHDATLNLQRKLRKHPLGAWVKAQRGVGEKQGARLLAAIGDPYINSAKGTPRSVSALWAYCGLHVLPAGQMTGDIPAATADRNQLPAGHGGADTHARGAGGVQLPGGQWTTDAHTSSAAGNQHGGPGHEGDDVRRLTGGVAAKRRKGERANWSGNAKMRAYLVAESCMKQLVKPCHAADFDGRWLAVHYTECTCSPYRVAYDTRRIHTAVTHPEWTDGHSHNDALRVSAKAILRDLWRAARDHHNGATS